jgi:hypothetical protein
MQHKWMGQMVRVLTAVVSLLVLGSLGAAADDAKPYRDPDGRFVVSVPASWTLARPADSESDIALMMTSSADENVKGGSCFIAVRDMAQTRETSQKEIDEAFGELMSDDFWKSVFEASGIKDAKIETSGNRVQKGRKVFFVVATVTSEEAGGPAEQSTGRQEVHPVPGSLQFVQCVAPKNIYAKIAPAFDTIFASFEPKANQLIAGAAPKTAPSVLTLFTGNASETKVIAQNLANVPALAGSDIATGIAIAGEGRWEICEGVNYAGSCKIVAGVSEMHAPLRIGSVRRYMGGHDMKAAAQLITAATAANFKTAKTVMQAKR